MTLKQSIVLYGFAMAALIGILKFFEYRLFVRDLSLEVYVGIVALLFVILGAWAGRRLTRTKIVRSDPNFVVDESSLRRLGITRREHEVLELIAAGMSNNEIAAKLFVSTSTIKTHASRLFSKLDANRRTHAIKRAKELGILR
jgi:two-component system, NarL family, response regulator LiaR